MSPADASDAAALAIAYCDHCGQPIDAGDHSMCRAKRELEPPRFCPFCRRRMVVQVVPTGWTARCAAHGVTRGSA